jgi:serine/threonine protein phosphatase 1
MKWNSWPARPRREAPKLPDGVRIYAIGDIHGRADLLKTLLMQIDIDRTTRPAARSITVFLGDYIDRGPESRGVIDLLLSHERQVKTAVFLKGNHETYVRRFLDNPAVLGEWKLFGGLETLCSYGLTPSLNPGKIEQERLSLELAALMPRAHLEFFDKLDISFACGNFFFVHAGLRPGIPICRQREEDLLWIRDEFLNCENRFEKFVVHGHTPVETFDMRTNRLNLDTGAFATGRLTCVAIEGDTIACFADICHDAPTLEPAGSSPSLRTADLESSFGKPLV